MEPYNFKLKESTGDSQGWGNMSWGKPGEAGPTLMPYFLMWFSGPLWETMLEGLSLGSCRSRWTVLRVKLAGNTIYNWAPYILQWPELSTVTGFFIYREKRFPQSHCFFKPRLFFFFLIIQPATYSSLFRIAYKTSFTAEGLPRGFKVLKPSKVI